MSATRPLEDKVAIITGASSGIGAASARLFAEAGAAVVLAARSADALEAVAADVRAGGGQAVAVPTDVTDPTAVGGLVQSALDAFGRLDVAFNNAGGGHMPAPLADLDVEQFDNSLLVNLRGTFLCMQHEIRAMLAGGGGAIVNMSSTAGLQGVRGISGYSASKHGVIGLTKCAALDYGLQGIRANVVAPGPILTGKLKALPDGKKEWVTAGIPMGRAGEPEEVAATAVWLCSDHASYLNGVTVPIEGGKMAGMS